MSTFMMVLSLGFLSYVLIQLTRVDALEQGKYCGAIINACIHCPLKSNKKINKSFQLDNYCNDEYLSAGNK